MSIVIDREPNKTLTDSQFGHLPSAERPKDGPVIDVRDALMNNRTEILSLGNVIRTKRDHTANKMPEGVNAVFLSRPLVWNQQSEHVQATVAGWMGNVIGNVYGDNYPLPNIHASFNQAGIENGTLLPYFGVIAPSDVSSDSIFADPEQVLRQDVQPVVVSALMMHTNGKGELGRSARLRGAEDFDGGAITTERVYDWLRNRHRLLERVHTLVSETRAGEEHGNNPSSGPVQNLILGKMGMKIVGTAPLYDVDGMEPMLMVQRPRNEKLVQNQNIDTVIYTPKGSHTELLQALWEHQLGQPVKLITTEAQTEEPHKFALVEDNGPHIYGSVTVLTDGQAQKALLDGKSVVPLNEATQHLDKTSASVFVKIPAERPESAATQQQLLDEGFVVCGVEPSRNEEFLQTDSSGEPSVVNYEVPATILMSRLGERARIGEVNVSKPYFPTPEESKGVDLHGESLRKLLYDVHEQLQAQVQPQVVEVFRAL